MYKCQKCGKWTVPDHGCEAVNKERIYNITELIMAIDRLTEAQQICIKCKEASCRDCENRKDIEHYLAGNF